MVVRGIANNRQIRVLTVELVSAVKHLDVASHARLRYSSAAEDLRL